MKKFNSTIIDSKLKLIHDILLNIWDPIGIHNISECQDEYERYEISVLFLLNKSNCIELIKEYLIYICENFIGVKPDLEKISQTSIELEKIKGVYE